MQVEICAVYGRGFYKKRANCIGSAGEYTGKGRKMTIDRSKLATLATYSDEELWKHLCAVGGQMGLSLPGEMPPPQTMAKIRALMKDPEKLNMIELMRLYGHFKRGK